MHQSGEYYLKSRFLLYILVPNSLASAYFHYKDHIAIHNPYKYILTHTHTHPFLVYTFPPSSFSRYEISHLGAELTKAVPRPQVYFLLTATVVELYLPMFWVVSLPLFVFVEDGEKKKKESIPSSRIHILFADLITVLFNCH